MNQRLAQLIKLLGLKKEATHKAYLELIKANEQIDQHKIREEQLIGYKLDYIEQVRALGEEGVSIVRLRNRLYFISHLDNALVQLGSLFIQLQHSRTQAELKYRQAKIAEEGIVKLIERAQKAEDLKMDKILQKDSDEFAQKKWYGKKNNDQ